MPLTQVSAALLSSEANAQGFRNRIINGDMRIDQRNAGASVNITGTAAYPVDRFYGFATQTSRLTMQRNAGSVTPPVGFTNYVGATVVSAASLSGGDEFTLTQVIEGFNTADFAWGSANAVTVTLSFWVRSSLTGTFSGSLRNDGAARSYPFTFTISAANTWELETVTISGDTSGTWLTNNGAGVIVTFGLGAGPSKKTTAGAWAAGNFTQSTGSVDLVSTNGATFYITGVQLEAGTVADPFERIDYGRQLIQCQRYYEAVADRFIWAGNATNGVTYFYAIPFGVTKRATPTITITNTDASGFPSSASSVAGTTTLAAVRLSRVASATANGSLFADSITASSEL
jgi:hypothetical protein